VTFKKPSSTDPRANSTCPRFSAPWPKPPISRSSHHFHSFIPPPENRQAFRRHPQLFHPPYHCDTVIWITKDTSAPSLPLLALHQPPNHKTLDSSTEVSLSFNTTLLLPFSHRFRYPDRCLSASLCAISCTPRRTLSGNHESSLPRPVQWLSDCEPARVIKTNSPGSS